MANYAVRRKTVRKHVDGADLIALSERGFVKVALNEANEQIVVARLPELLASELAFLLARRLASQSRKIGQKRPPTGWWINHPACHLVT